MNGLRIVLGVLALAMFVDPSYAQLTLPTEKSVATVNGEPILHAEFEAALKLEHPMLSQMPENERRAKEYAVLGALIEDRLLQQFLRTAAAPVSDAEISKYLTQLESNLKMSGHTLQEYALERGWNDAQLRRGIAEMLQWANYVNARLTDPEVRRYYDENKDFFDRVSVRASHIVFRVPAAGAETERIAARAKMQNLRLEIFSGKIDFAEAARKYSQCTSALKGGDIGYFLRKGVIDESIARAAFTLKVGEISDVVDTDYGVHLVKTTERKPGQPSHFENIKDDVRLMAAEEIRASVLAQQRKTARVEVLLTTEALTKTGHP